MTDLVASWFHRAIEQTVAGNGDWCVSANSNTNSNHWVQITWEHLNIAFPFELDPNDVIARLPNVPYLEIVEYEHNSFLTLAHGADVSLPAIAEFVATYAKTFLKDPVTSDWKMTEEAL